MRQISKNSTENIQRYAKMQIITSFDRLAGCCANGLLAPVFTDSKRWEEVLPEHLTTGHTFIYFVSFIYSQIIFNKCLSHHILYISFIFLQHWKLYLELLEFMTTIYRIPQLCTKQENDRGGYNHMAWVVLHSPY